ncbi:MAG TPA: DUF5939 domain-containing protein [Chloroflexota bacterium]|nr:DUF5939 domain-containing protein [Chloroflexota bacterium]
MRAKHSGPPEPISAETVVHVPVDADRLWPFIADTDRIDRAIRLPKPSFTRTPLTEGGEEYHGSHRFGGLTVARWIERPYEWERPRRFAVVRDYHAGVLRRSLTGAELLADSNGGTRIRAFLVFTPANGLVAPLIRHWLVPRGLRLVAEQYRAIGAFAAAHAAEPLPDPSGRSVEVDSRRLDTLIDRLQSERLPPSVLSNLRRLVAVSADEDVAGMRPLALAEGWGCEPRETLDTFLRATSIGLLEMRWELLCPSCRGVKAEASRLEQLAASGFCPACNLHFEPTVDQAVEARFYPSPAVRRVQLYAYCVGSPMQTPHRVAQAHLEPRETRALQLQLRPGRYVVRSPQCRGLSTVCVAAPRTSDRATITLSPTGLAPQRVEMAAGGVSLELTNGLPHVAIVGVDDDRWSQAAATPGRLITSPAFQRLFAFEALAPGVELAVGHVGLVFTDLAGSTALYNRAGDARAFRLVGEHFEVLRGAIEAHEGALVKTIGDAIMAAFPDGRSALGAALAMQRAIRGMDTHGLADPTRLVKAGVHAGACYVVTLNGRLDYFGTTVNLAARAQHEAQGGEVVATDEVLVESADLLAVSGLSAELFEVVLRGFPSSTRLHRIDCVVT